MNINDVKIEELWPTAVKLYGTDDPLEIIFARQRELMEKYLALESELMGGEIVTIPVDLHSAKGQRSLKERAWWFTEELVESLDALKEEDSTKFLEEMSDALHFITELWILTGLDRAIIRNPEKSPGIPTIYQLGFKTSRGQALGGYYMENTVSAVILNIIVSLGRSMWQLRNKPWKQTQVLTDIPMFQLRLRETYEGLLELLHFGCKLSFQSIALLYLRKSEVNKFRQRSKY